jgi:CO/xanthine dehydrogenase FAD-binding subunit
MRSFKHINARTVDEACALLREYKGKAMLNAGGTEILSTLKGEHLSDYPEAVINIKTVPGLDYIREEKGVLKIGALTRLCDIAKSSLLKSHCKVLVEAAHSVATPQIRNAATIGGNVCNASPAGDLLTPLLALDAEIELARLADDGGVLTRRVPMADFVIGPGRTQRTPHELLTAVRLPVAQAGQVVRFYKGGTRQALDISSISIALAARRVGGDVLRDVRLALGAVGPTPLRAREAEAALESARLDADTIGAAAQAAAAGAKPIDDVRASAWYRRELLRNMTERMLNDVAQS